MIFYFGVNTVLCSMGDKLFTHWMKNKTLILPAEKEILQF